MHSFIIGLAFFAILPTELDAANDDEDKTPKNKGVRISTEPEDIVYNVNSQNFRDAVFRLTSAPQQQTSSSKRSASSPTASGGGGGDAIKVPKFDGIIAAVPSQPSLAPNVLAWMVPLAQQQQQQAVGQLQDNATTLGTAAAASAEGINVSKRKHSATEFGGNSKNMKMKGPLKAEPEETIDGRLPAGAELQIAAEKALLRLDNSNLETQVFRILELSMWAIDFTFMGLNFVRTIQRNLTGLYKKLGKKFKKMNVKSVTKQLKGLLLDNELAKKNPIFSDIFEQIEAQIVNVFGHSPFKMEEDEQKNLIGIMPAEQSKSAENNSKMHGVLLFFYARLFRKLAGLLEAPYKSPINPTKPQLSHREGSADLDHRR
ncbi:hypothetical protein GPALN_007739 [Globodera pallida]|nr:hypothetical protein GPALN_007739 [Globodera pallida]